MSRTELRRWLALGSLAFCLRAGAALLTEARPLFPAYYYQDAVFAESIAWDMASTWRDGHSYLSPYSAAQRAHALALAVPYYIVGRKPLVNKLVNAALGALGVLALGLALHAAASERAAFLATALTALWPSHVFYTSQNFKEAPLFLPLYAGLALLLRALAPGPGAAPASLAAGAALLAAAGVLRAHAMTILAASVAAGALWGLRERARRRIAILTLAAACAAPILHRFAAAPLLAAAVALPPDVPQDLPALAPIERTETPPPPVWTPAGLSHRRAQRQASDRAFALKSSGREIGTQLYPDARFESWLDVALFLPKGAFTALFMPLPGLYPLEGKPGRWLAALENIALLALCAAAALGLARGALTPTRLALLAFFCLMAAASALAEFDLGSASRHKLLYLPMLFPFAAETLLRRRRA